MLSMPSAFDTCSGATASGINAAIPPSADDSTSIAPSSTSRSNASSATLRMSMRYGTPQRNASASRSVARRPTGLMVGHARADSPPRCVRSGCDSSGYRVCGRVAVRDTAHRADDGRSALAGLSRVLLEDLSA
jgi:hypothetical protein